MPTISKAPKASTISAEAVDLGHGTYDAYMNMAIDDVLLVLADKTKKFFFRTYDFTRESVILANSDSPMNLKKHARIKSGKHIDVTRRISGGKPIYVDVNTLSYSIIGPLSEGSGSLNQTSINELFAPTVLKAIADTIGSDSKLNMGRVFSIKFDGKPIVGNAQHISQSHSFLYHGVIAIGPWSSDKINKYLRLSREDSDALPTLPNIHDIAGNGYSVQEYKSLLSKRLHSYIDSLFSSKSELSEAEKDEMMKSAASKAKKVYADTNWINRKDISLKEDSRFCLLWPD